MKLAKFLTASAKHPKFLAAACAMAVTLGLPTVASATLITQTFTIDINPAAPLAGITDFAGSPSINKFDPSLGTLNSLSYGLSGLLVWSGINNFVPLVEFPELDGFSFSGPGIPSAACLNYGLCSVSLSFTNTNAANLGYVTGTGSVAFGLTLIGNPGDTVTTNFDGDFPLTGAVIYDYTPADVDVPEPATLALFGAGLAGLGALRRRRKAKA